MSCCPKAPAVKTSSDGPPIGGPEQSLRPGETIECFSQRAGNSTGALDDTIVAKNKIAVESVTTNCDAGMDIQFKLAAGSDATPITWTISGDEIPGTTFSSSGHLLGTVHESVHDKKLSITVKASWPAASDGSTGDERTYSFAAGKCKGGDSIKFLMPLADGVLKSPYGMRFHPIQKLMKLHSGIDLVMNKKGVHGDVFAAADGICIKAKNTDPRGYGNAIHVKHLNSRGEHLCTTTYNHLYRMLVKEGDRVSAGQKIGLEGGISKDPGSGGSTGLHLHFECKLPNGSFTDPLPYMKGAVRMAATGESVGAIGAVRSADSTAKGSCPPMQNYPIDPAAPEPAVDSAPLGTSTVPFELAWFFTMKFEVGPHWTVLPGQMPSDAEIIAGLCETSEQKRKCGYKMWLTSTGGETKFGIAKSGNPATNIKVITYQEAKDLGFSNYWKRGKIVPKDLAEQKNAPYLAVFMFDTNFQHGPGGGATIWNDSAPAASWPDKQSQMEMLERLYNRRLDWAKTLKNPDIRLGVARRVQACYDYVKALNF